LRSAIEQAFGAFISSKTEVLNDQIVADEMASISSGNIKSYEVLNQDSLPGGRWGVTLKTIVSVEKLTNFVQAKGISVEIKGGLFAMNVKQQILNEQGEIKAIAEMVGVLHEPMQMAFDYTIEVESPRSVDEESKNWEIPITVTAVCNKNMEFCASYFMKTLSALSLTASEVETYNELNKQVFPVSVLFDGIQTNYYLRKRSSLSIIESFTSNWKFYTRLFAVQSGMDEVYGLGEGYEHLFLSYNRIQFLTQGSIGATFNWNEKRTLNQIEQMEGYTVKPRGVISRFNHGGYVVYEKDGHGVVMAIYDIGIYYSWDAAKTACDDLELNGYSDWRLPNVDDLKFWESNILLNAISLGYMGIEDHNLRWCGEGRVYVWAPYDNRVDYFYPSSDDVSENFCRPFRSF
jgi:hypothetical protein